MGFPYAFLRMPRFYGIKDLLNLLFHIRFMFAEAITHLGLFNPPELSDQPHGEEQSSNYVLVTDPLCPSPIPVPVHVLTALIKKRLPVIKYSERLQDCRDYQGGICPVCLDCLGESDEIRELCNCTHVFHRVCLDSWVDTEQVTCPTCRSMLFPDNKGGARGVSWIFSCGDSAVEASS